MQTITAQIIAMSPLLVFQKAGHTVFLDTILINSCEHRFLALSIHKKSMMNHLSIGCIYSFRGLRKCRRKSPDCQHIWYYTDTHSENTVLTQLPQYNLMQSERILNFDAHTGHELEIFLPESFRQKFSYENEPLTISGQLLRICSWWLEMNFHQKIMCVFLNQGILSEIVDGLHKWVRIHISSVLPVYLWGELFGFATTVRSRIVILDSCKASRLNEPISIRLPADIGERCFMYAAWRIYLDRALISTLGLSVASCAYPKIAALLHNHFHAKDSTLDNLPLLQLTRKPLTDLQTDFEDIASCQIYLVRAGHDADWLSAQMPQVIFCID